LDIPLNLLKDVLSEIFELYGSTLNICRECNHSFSRKSLKQPPKKIATKFGLRGIHANENIMVNKIIVKIGLVLVQTLEFAIHLKWF
jgi:hypothetical protein